MRVLRAACVRVRACVECVVEENDTRRENDISRKNKKNVAVCISLFSGSHLYSNDSNVIHTVLY